MRILIFRPGSLGDIVVALPCFHLIAEVFPHAERRVLTCSASNPAVSPIEHVLGPTGLIHSHLSYAVKLRAPICLWRVWRWIRRWRPDVLIYLAEPRGVVNTWRDALFFRLCGIPRVVGLPLTRDLREPRPIGRTGLFEHAADRLASRIRSLGDADVRDVRSWDLHLTDEEERTAAAYLDGWTGREHFVALGAGARVDVKDWGLENWTALLARLGPACPGVGLALVGSEDDAPRARALLEHWTGPTLNLCGRLTPRESAAVIRQARLYIGHDGGPMHLAHAVGTRCVAVFSAQAKPGVWFPYGERHRVLYHQTPCFGCGLESCVQFHKACIRSITVDEVHDAVIEIATLAPAPRSRSVMA